MLNRLAFGFYKFLLALSGVAMLGAFVAIMLNIMARIFLWNIPGLDGYAGYAIAAALFLALPIVRRPDPHFVTAAFGGYLASGPPAADSCRASSSTPTSRCAGVWVVCAAFWLGSSKSLGRPPSWASGWTSRPASSFAAPPPA